MAEPIFKTIDYSNQIANNNKAASDSMVKGIQNISNTFLAGRQNNINQARQLMSDFDAVINEVDDMHKENVSGQIAKTQQQLANNIYKKKGKNGVRLQLGDMNSKDFNYARDMRKLKNLATNSRMSRESLDSARDYAKNHKYFESSQQRTEYLAEVATFYSDPKTLNASPKQVQEADRDLRLQYTDVASEAKDIILDDMTKNRESSYSMKDGDEYKTTVTSYGDLFKDGDIDEAKITEHAQLYIDRTGIDQTNLESIKDKLRDSATSTVTDRNIRKEQFEKERLVLEAQKVAAKEKKEDSEKIEFTNDNIVEFSSQMASSDREVADKAVRRFNASSQVKKSIIFSNQSEYTQAMIETDRDALKRSEVTSREDGEALKSPLDDPDGYYNDTTLKPKIATAANPLTQKDIKDNSIIEELRVKYKVGESATIDFNSMSLKDRVKYFKIDHRLAVDYDAKNWYENYKRVEEYYADRWPPGLSPDSEVMFTRFKDDKLPPTLHDRFDKGMNQTQIRNLNNNSTGAIEDQVNPTVKKGILDPPD